MEHLPILSPNLVFGLVYGVGGFCVVIQHSVPSIVYITLVLGTLSFPFFLGEDETQSRALVSLLVLYYTTRLLQLHGSRTSYFNDKPLIVRYAHVFFTFHDIRIRKIVQEKTFDRKSFFDLICNTALTACAMKLVYNYGKDLETSEGVAASCIFGACIGLLSLNIMCGLLRFLALLTGPFELPKLMDDPATSTTLREFWGQRWDSVLQALLKEYVYLPMRRQGYSRPISSACTFFASGLGHTLPIFCGLKDLRMMGAMLGYFLVQFLLLMTQDAFFDQKKALDGKKSVFWWGVTMALVLIPAPLFVLPALCLAKWCPSNPMDVFYQQEFWKQYVTNVFCLIVFVRIFKSVTSVIDVNALLESKPPWVKKD
jgi:hypothetical protein